MPRKKKEIATVVLNVKIARRHEDVLTRLYVERLPSDAKPVRSRGFRHPWAILRELLELIDADGLPVAPSVRRGRTPGQRTIGTVGVTVEVPRERVVALDRWAFAEGHPSRSAAVRALVDALIEARPDLAQDRL